MANRGRSPKVVADPISGIVDIGPVLPLVETPQFQALADKRQLGMTYLVFRSATHSRFAHSLGAYQRTRELADRWVAEGMITRLEERDALVAYALLHDIGHPAFSHVTEDFCEKDDDEMTLQIIKERVLDKPLLACGIRLTYLSRIAAHQKPLYRAVHDKNLGTEKLDYLERDGFYTGFGRPAGIEYLRKYVYWVNNQVAIDEKVVDHAIDVQNFYMKMYKGVYLRKSLVIAQRMFHKAVHGLIQCGELDPRSLPAMTDSELLALLYTTREPSIQRLYRLLRNRELFREAIAIRPEHFVHETRIGGKPIAALGVSQSDMEQIIASPDLQKKNHLGLDVLEDRIADATGIPRGEILVVPVFNPERFRAQDITVLGSDGNLHSLRERRPAHFMDMEETARSYAALRICATPRYRKALSDSAAVVLDLVLARAG